MKKIVSAALVASLVAGAAFAEVTVSANFRLRPVFATWNMGTEADTMAEYFDLDSVQGAKDDVTFKAKNDYAGVESAITIDGTNSAVSFSKYTGYLKFGNLTFTGGVFDSRIADRVTKDQNNLSLIEQNWGGIYNTADVLSGDVYYTKKTNNKIMGNKKLGVNATCGASVGIDSDNITAINGSKAVSFVTDYVFADVAGGKLQVWGALNKNKDEWPTTNDDGVVTTKVDSSYAFRAAYTADAFSANATMHIIKKALTAAVFVSPKVDGLLSTFGFTFAQDDNNGDDADVYWAIDARARYGIDDATFAGIYLNYTNADEGDGADADGVLDAVLNVNHKLNDIVKVFAEAELVFFTNSDTVDAQGHQLAAQLGGLFTAGKNAEIDVAARMVMAGLSADQDKDTLGTQISIPCCMRIKM